MHVSQRRSGAQEVGGASVSEQVESSSFLAFAICCRIFLPVGSPTGLSSLVLAPFRAVGEREQQLVRFLSFQLVAPFAPPSLHGFNANTRRSDCISSSGTTVGCGQALPGFFSGLRASIATGSTTNLRGPEELSRGKRPRLPAAAAPTTVRPRLDIGYREWGHTNPGRPALRGFIFIRCCSSQFASTPHVLADWCPKSLASWHSCSCICVHFPPVGYVGDFHPRSRAHARHKPAPPGRGREEQRLPYN